MEDVVNYYVVRVFNEMEIQNFVVENQAMASYQFVTDLSVGLLVVLLRLDIQSQLYKSKDGFAHHGALRYTFGFAGKYESFVGLMSRG